MPEADIRTTRDGVIVAFHDRDFARVVSEIAPERRKMGVENVSFEELSQMDVGAEHPGGRGYRAIALREALVALKEQAQRQLYLDIKNVVLEDLARLVIKCGVENQIIFASTQYGALRAWKALVPASQTLLWMGGEEDHLEKRLHELREANFEAISQLQIHVHFDSQQKTPQFKPSDAWLHNLGKELHERGVLFQTLPWGASDAAIYRRLLALGVESFATDYPDVVLRIVRDFQAKTVMV